MISFISDYMVWISLMIIYLFIAFVFVARVKHKVVGTKFELLAKIFLVIPFILFDWIVNIGMSLLFLDPPDKVFELVTGRMKRYKLLTRYSNMDKFRSSFAFFICSKLNQHDAEHC